MIVPWALVAAAVPRVPLRQVARSASTTSTTAASSSASTRSPTPQPRSIRASSTSSSPASRRSSSPRSARSSASSRTASSTSTPAMMVARPRGARLVLRRSRTPTRPSTESGNGDYVVTAAPGLGYGYRWYPDAQGSRADEGLRADRQRQGAPRRGHDQDGQARGEERVQQRARHARRQVDLPPIAAKEITLTRPKADKPAKLELGER